MVHVNLADGTTRAFDLREPAALAECSRVLDCGPAVVRGIGVHHGGRLSTLPLPRGFRDPARYGAGTLGNGEASGEFVYAQVDAVRVTLSVYWASGMARVDLVRTGRQRYTPASTRTGDAP